jgi:hypothetical protein
LHLAEVHLVARHGGEQLVRFGKPELRGKPLEACLRSAFPAQLLLDDLPALRDRLRERLGVEPLADLMARARALDKAALGVQPVSGRPAGLRRYDLDALTALQRRIELYAKSIGVEPAGRSMTLPCGVIT